MIIGIAGRKCSGKAEIANVLAKTFKSKRHYMALPLKKIISELVGFEVNDKQETKTAIVNKVLSREDISLISKRTSIKESFIEKETQGIVFSTVRDMLQIIGTDVIRKYNPSWHVDEVMKLIDDKSSYVFDDVRFPNEKQAIEERGGDVWFITRPKIDEISNHISETSLQWQNFGNKLIFNNIPLNALRKKWKFAFTEIYLNDKKQLRDKISNLLDTSFLTDMKDRLPYSTDDIVMLINNLMVPFPYLYESEKLNYSDYFSQKENKTLKVIKGALTIKENNKRKIITSNPLTIENIKKFL